MFTTGKIIGKLESNDPEYPPSFYPIIAFQDEEEDKYEIPSSFPLFPSQIDPYLDKNLKIAYDPTNPYSFEVVDFHPVSYEITSYIIFICFSLFILIITYSASLIGTP